MQRRDSSLVGAAEALVAPEMMTSARVENATLPLGFITSTCEDGSYKRSSLNAPDQKPLVSAAHQRTQH
jgi:hypothetical protein